MLLCFAARVDVRCPSKCVAAKGMSVLQPPSRGSSAEPATRVQRFAASILQYIRNGVKAGKTETFESVIRYILLRQVSIWTDQ